MVTYVILNKTDIVETVDDETRALIDFSKLLNRNESMLRYSLDGTKAVVKYKGDQVPDFLDGKTDYTHGEILVEMAKSTWTEEI